MSESEDQGNNLVWLSTIFSFGFRIMDINVTGLKCQEMVNKWCLIFLGTVNKQTIIYQVFIDLYGCSYYLAFSYIIVRFP